MNARVMVFTAALAAATAAGAGCEHRETGYFPPAGGAAGALLKGGETSVLRLREVPVTRALAGTVRSSTVSRVSSRLMAEVVEIKVQEGDRVEKGDLLVVLDGRDLEAKARQAEGALGQARAQHGLAEVTLGRYRTLLDGRAVSRQEFDQVEAKEKVAREALSQAQSAVAEAATWLAFTGVRAPVSGRVVEKRIDEGSMAVPGMPLLIIEPAGGYQAEIPVDVSLSGSVEPGTPLSVSVEATGFDGAVTVTEVVPTVDPASRTFTVKADLPAAGRFRTGQYVRATLSIGTRRALLAPTASLVRRGQLDGVFAVDGGTGTLSFRIVRVGGEVSPGSIEVLSGLSEGDVVLTGGLDGAREGMRVSLPEGGLS